MKSSWADWLFMVGPWVVVAAFILRLFYFNDRTETLNKPKDRK